MDLLSMVTSGGVWPALPWTGYWLWWRPWRSHRESNLPVFTNLALMTVAGMAVWSVGMFGAAMAGVYRPACFGAVGWVVTLASVAWWVGHAKTTLSFRELHFHRWSVSNGILAAGLLLAAWFYVRYPTDSMVTGADEAVYASHGIYLAKHGRLDVLYPWPGGLDPVFDQEFKRHLALPGLDDNGSGLTVQFAHLFPVWLGQAFATTGALGLFRVNGALACLSLITFYGFCQLLVPRPAALAAALFLGFNVSQLWLARITLSEVFTQLWIWSGLLLLYQALQGVDRFLAFWGGAFLGMASLVRCDAWLLPAFLFLAHLVFKLVKSPDADKSAPVWRAAYSSALPLTALAVGQLWFFSRPYFLDLSRYFVAIGWITGGCLVALAVTRPYLRELARPLLQAPTTVMLIGLGMVAAAAYAYYVRPRRYPGDFSSYSVENLAAYLSPLVIWAAVGGAWLAVRAACRPGGNPAQLPLLVVALGYAFGFLWQPSIDVFHFWAIRRFVPVVIPAFVMFAALGLSWLVQQLPRHVWLLAAAGILGFVSYFDFRAGQLIWRVAENYGMYPAVRELAEHLPRGELVLAYGMPERFLPLFLAFDCPVVSLSADDKDAPMLMERWVAARLADNKPAYLLCENVRFPGQHTRELFRQTCVRACAEEVWKPLPEKMATISWTNYLYEIRQWPSPADYLDFALGKEKVWGIDESGFYNARREAGQTIRGTRGSGRLVIPLDRRCLPTVLKVDLLLKPPKTDLRVLVNGRELFREVLPSGDWFQEFELAGVPMDRVLTIDLVSTTFVPRQVIEGSYEDEPVGVFVKEVRLLQDNPGKGEGRTSRQER
jgi:hypothetical protein